MKKIACIAISIITILFGGFVLFELGFVLLGLMANFSEMRFEDYLVILRVLGETLVVFVLPKFLLSKEKFKETIKAMFVALVMIVINLSVGINMYGSSDLAIMVVGAVVLAISMAVFHHFKLSWMFYLASVYAASLGMYVLINNIEI